MKNLKDNRFGKLTVLGAYTTFTNTRKRNERKWLCRCDCGTEKYILERSLLSGAMLRCFLVINRINFREFEQPDLSFF